MYEIPSRPEIRRVNVNADAIHGDSKPQLQDEKGKDLAYLDETLPDAA
jgi:ATP-dependent protease Clp ATPase subunit